MFLNLLRLWLIVNFIGVEDKGGNASDVTWSLKKTQEIKIGKNL